MITYEKISKKPQIANSLIGMPLAEFDQLYAEFEVVYNARMRAAQYTRRRKLKRRRAAGAGRRHKYCLRNRLLMALFWLRAYTTYAVLGSLYELNKTTVEDILHDVFDTLAEMTTYRFELPEAEVPRLHSVQEVINAFPDIRFIIDA